VSPTPLLLLHGFTGSARSWDDLVATLGPRFRGLAVDLVGHGPGPQPGDLAAYAMQACVQDVLAALDREGVSRTAALGYSMGGRVALHLALAAPERITALVLESASPGLVDAAERAARVASDEALADAIERDGLPAFVASWERLPLLALGPHVPADVRTRLRAERLNHDPRGLANSLRGMGAGRPPAVWHRLAELRMPVLLVVGARDRRYRQIGERMLRALPDARLEVVAEAGHTVHLDQPDRFADLVGAFVRQQVRTTY
jgi:2-succinyl-6-hydroxy-2,4-cyclohexadiene-1-carboxylate synthase